jgi:hypothetical protein
MAAGGDDFSWRVIPYWRLRNAANRYLPGDVQHGLSAYARSDLADARARFAEWTRTELRHLYREWPFDVFLLPSDAFYYARELPDACHALGIPLVIAQKETTITEYFISEHAPDVKQHAPFVSDVMTVCSELHKRFWIAAGTDPERIVVTGQPRFDVYADPPAALDWPSIGLARHPRTLVFLSFDTDAYLLDEADRAIGWRDLRSDIEQAIAAAAADGWRVLVKLHPLQDEAAERERLRTQFGSMIELVPSTTDTRLLLLLVDAVVGFQTTALYEAMMAGKPVAYSAWGSLYERFAPNLIPFESRGDLLDVLRSIDELRRWLKAPPIPDPEQAAQRKAFIEATLGPVDGEASQRTLEVIRDTHIRWRSTGDGDAERRRLSRLAPALAAATTVRAGSRLAALATLATFARILPGPLGARLARSAGFRRDSDREDLRTALRTLRSSR